MPPPRKKDARHRYYERRRDGPCALHFAATKRSMKRPIPEDADYPPAAPETARLPIRTPPSVALRSAVVFSERIEPACAFPPPKSVGKNSRPVFSRVAAGRHGVGRRL